jgi:hypothetical protein
VELMKIALIVVFIVALLNVSLGVYVDTTSNNTDDRLGSLIPYTIGGVLFAADVIGALIYVLVKL